MNARAHGSADARAHGKPHGWITGTVTRTVHAKRREGKGPDRTTPEVTTSVETPNPTYVSDARAKLFWSKVTVTPGCWIWNAGLQVSRGHRSSTAPPLNSTERNRLWRERRRAVA